MLLFGLVLAIKSIFVECVKSAKYRSQSHGSITGKPFKSRSSLNWYFLVSIHAFVSRGAYFGLNIRALSSCLLFCHICSNH